MKRQTEVERDEPRERQRERSKSRSGERIVSNWLNIHLFPWYLSHCSCPIFSVVLFLLVSYICPLLFFRSQALLVHSLVDATQSSEIGPKSVKQNGNSYGMVYSLRLAGEKESHVARRRNKIITVIFGYRRTPHTHFFSVPKHSSNNSS